MRKLVEETLRLLDPEIKYSEEAVELVLGTFAQESAYGKYRKQLGNGPALGIGQMEPATFNDCVTNYLNFRHELKRIVLEVSGVSAFSVNDLYLNDRLSICMCRVAYLRCKGAIPNTIEGYAKYWKIGYNTILGKGTEQEFIHNYKFYVEKEVSA